MALLDKKVWKEMVALGKELGLEGERLAEYVDKQTHSTKMQRKEKNRAKWLLKQNRENGY